MPEVLRTNDRPTSGTAPSTQDMTGTSIHIHWRRLRWPLHATEGPHQKTSVGEGLHLSFRMFDHSVHTLGTRHGSHHGVLHGSPEAICRTSRQTSSHPNGQRNELRGSQKRAGRRSTTTINTAITRVRKPVPH